MVFDWGWGEWVGKGGGGRGEEEGGGGGDLTKIFPTIRFFMQHWGWSSQLRWSQKKGYMRFFCSLTAEY